MSKNVRSAPLSGPVAPPTESKVDQCEAALSAARAQYHSAQDRLGELQLKYVGSENEESERHLAAVHAEIEKSERSIVALEKAMERAKIQYAEQERRRNAEKQTERWSQAEKDGLEMLDLAKKADEHLEKALEIFWQLIPRGTKLYQTIPSNDGTALQDCPIGGPEIQGFLRKHLRKHGMLWAWEHFEHQVETLPTISKGIDYGLQWLHKQNPNNPYKAKEETPTPLTDPAPAPVETKLVETGIEITSRPRKPRISVPVGSVE